MNKNSGMTLIELIVALIITGIALYAVITIVLASINNFNAARKAPSLQQDLDLAAYTIKGVTEEASEIYAPATGDNNSTLDIGYTATQPNWEKKFYPLPSNPKVLILENTSDSGQPTRQVINDLDSLTFTVITASEVQVNIAVGSGSPSMSFIVTLRNSQPI